MATAKPAPGYPTPSEIDAFVADLDNKASFLQDPALLDARDFIKRLLSINPVADSTGEKTGTHGASKEAGGRSRDGLTPASSSSVTDEMIEAALKVQHSASVWGRHVKNPTMAAWVDSHRVIMRRVLIAALDARSGDPAEVWEAYLAEVPDANARSLQGALAFGYAAGRP